MYDDILVPTDGSTCATAAVEEAIDHAKTHDARLHFLYVVDETRIPTEDQPELYDSLEAEGEAAISDARTKAKAADITSIRAELGAGAPHQVIVDYATENDVDLIVMGTHGRSGLERALLGSTTERVLRTADPPVLTVRESGEKSD
ncbi:universal stress protein [Natronomonas halophila]|uniref:universal stress protein n=1 Tax=Natronomonas halophila TaxID=2747817 RepID=UPI0015B46161|nr:universal stress protein [Natronomonas halophila]QLD86194.1 universal stress protein [Natronomonas halophila]